MTLEKEKHIAEEKMRSELDSLKREQLTFSADTGKQQALEAQISYLQGEINQLNRALKVHLSIITNLSINVLHILLIVGKGSPCRKDHKRFAT